MEKKKKKQLVDIIPRWVIMLMAIVYIIIVLYLAYQIAGKRIFYSLISFLVITTLITLWFIREDKK